jgi:hypothetical protein
MVFRLLKSRSFRASAAGVLVSGLLVFTSNPVAFAEDGRDFSAFYDVRDIVPIDSEHVSITLVLQLQNHSGADVDAAELSLRDSLQPLDRFGSFPDLVRAANHEVIRLSAMFVITTRESDAWSRGARPQLLIEYRDTNGEPQSRYVELAGVPGTEG